MQQRPRGINHVNPTPWRGRLDIEGARLVDPSRRGWPPGEQFIGPPARSTIGLPAGSPRDESGGGGLFRALLGLTLPTVGSSLYSRDPVHQGSNHADSRFGLDRKSFPEPALNLPVFGLGRGVEDGAGRENP